MLKYKAEWEGKTYLEIDRFFPSSTTCSHCYHKVEELPLKSRSWVCPKCNTPDDRDINAAINIRDEGLRILSVGRIDRGVTRRRTAHSNLRTAQGRTVRLTSVSRRESTENLSSPARERQ
jgi:putative transposase